MKRKEKLKLGIERLTKWLMIVILVVSSLPLNAGYSVAAAEEERVDNLLLSLEETDGAHGRAWTSHVNTGNYDLPDVTLQFSFPKEQESITGAYYWQDEQTRLPIALTKDKEAYDRQLEAYQTYLKELKAYETALADYEQASSQVNVDSQKAELAELQAAADKAKANLASQQEELDAANRQNDQLAEGQEPVDTSAYQAAVAQAQVDLDAATQSIGKLQAEIDSLLAEGSELEMPKNPYNDDKEDLWLIAYQADADSQSYKMVIPSGKKQLTLDWMSNQVSADHPAYTVTAKANYKENDTTLTYLAEASVASTQVETGTQESTTIEETQTATPSESAPATQETAPGEETEAAVEAEPVVPQTEVATSEDTSATLDGLLAGSLFATEEPALARITRAVNADNLTPGTGSGSGTLMDGATKYGEYTWTGTLSADGKSINWQVIVKKTNTSQAAAARLKVEQNTTQYSGITNVSATSNGNASTALTGESYHWRAQNSSMRAADQYTLTVTFTTPILDAHLSDATFTLPIKPYILRSFYAYGPLNTTTTGVDALTATDMTVQNRVTESTVNVGASDNQGSPISGSTVTLTNVNDTSKKYTLPATNAQGESSLASVPFGTYSVTANDIAGYTLEPLTNITINQATTDLYVTYNKIQYSKVTYTIKDDNGNTVTGAQVVLTDKTDSSKTYTIDTSSGTGSLDIPYGTYTVTGSTVAGYEAPASSEITLNSATSNQTLTYKFLSDPNIQQFVTTGLTAVGQYDRATNSINWTVTVNKPANGALYNDARHAQTSITVPSGSGLGAITNMKVQVGNQTPTANAASGTAVTLNTTASTTAQTVTYTFTTPITDTTTPLSNPLKDYKIDVSSKLMSGTEEMIATATPAAVPLGISSTSLIVRLSETGNPDVKIGNAAFTITNTATGATINVTTDADGQIIQPLDPGNYTVKQTSTADGYRIADVTIPFTITANQAQVLELNNIKVPTSGGFGIVEVYVKDRATGAPLANSEVELVDELGNTKRGTTNANGYIVFDGVNTLRTYTLRQLSVPYSYQILEETRTIRFIEGGPFAYHAIATIENDQLETLRTEIIAREYGNEYKWLPNATFKIVSEKGEEFTVTTNDEGRVLINLVKGINYTITQLTAPDGYIISDEELTFYHVYPTLWYFDNKLVDPTTVVEDITAEKVWEDDRPSTVTELEFDLVRIVGGTEEVVATQKLNYADTSSPDYFETKGNKVTFPNIQKYDSNNETIKYVVREREVEGFYSTTKKASATKPAYTISNYAGENPAAGCYVGGIWVSGGNDANNNGWAYEVDGNGIQTGRRISLPTRNGPALAMTPDGYLLSISTNYGTPSGGQNRRGEYVAVYNTAVADPVKLPVEAFLNIGVNASSASDYMNSATVTPDGQYLLIKRWQSNYLLQYKVSDIIAAAKGEAGSTVNPEPTRINAPTVAGDIVFLADGSLLLSGLDRSGHNPSIYVIKRNADGSYASTWTDLGFIQGFNTTSGAIHALYEYNGGIYYGTSDSTNSAIYKIDQDIYNGATGPFTATRLAFPEGVTQGYFPQIQDAASAKGDCGPVVDSFKVSGVKEWENDQATDRPDSIRVQLFADGVATNKVITVTPDEFGNWTYTFEDIQKNNAAGTAIKYTVKEVGYTINGVYTQGTPPGYVVTYGDGDNDYSITNTLADTSLYIRKNDEANNPLADAWFTLYQEDQKTVHSNAKRSGTDGLITFDKLSVGTYYLKETQAPAGYKLDETFYKVVVSQKADGTLEVRVNDQTTLNTQARPFVVKNEKNVGRFELRKVDQDGQVITNNPATFQLKAQDGSVQQEVSTGTNGLLVFEDIPQGQYTLIESKAPNGYSLSDKEYQVVVDVDGEVTITLDGNIVSHLPLIVVNEKPQFDFALIKTGPDGQSRLEGAEFSLFSDAQATQPIDGYSNQPVSSTGELTFTNLGSGTYYLQETKAPNGYYHDTTIYEVVIASDGTVTVPNGGSVVTVEAVTTNGSTQVIFRNYPPGEFPDTGGFGSLPYILSGLLLVLFAAYAMRRRFYTTD